MASEFLAILQRNHVYLKQHLDGETTLDHLYQEGVFGQEEYDRCWGKETNSDKCQALLEALKLKGEDGYRTFCLILTKTQQFIKERLDETAISKGARDLVFVSRGTFDKEIARREREIERLNSVISQNRKRIEEQRRDLRMIYGEVDTLVQETTSNKYELQAYRHRCEKLRTEIDSSVWYFQNARSEEIVLLGPRLTMVSTSGLNEDLHRVSRFQDHRVPIAVEYPSCPIYWETNEEVELESTAVFGHPIFEFGLYEELDEKRRNSENQHPAWGISVELWPGRHFKSVCTLVWADKKLVTSFPETIPNRKGTKASLSFGTVLDAASGKLSFTDNNRGIVLCELEVDFKKCSYQVFAAGGNSKEGMNTTLTVTTGEDIDMSQEKQDLILLILH